MKPLLEVTGRDRNDLKLGSLERMTRSYPEDALEALVEEVRVRKSQSSFSMQLNTCASKHE